MVFNISAGHAAVGHGAVGAVSILSESKENRIVKNEVIRQLRLLGHTVYDCTVDDGNKQDVLSRCVAKCNEHSVDLDVQIHFNSGANDNGGNGKTTGTECYVYSAQSITANKYAKAISDTISKLGFKNRGVKVGNNLYYLKNTQAQAVLIECCFVDDRDDCLLYDAQDMADAIVTGLVGKKWVEPIIVVRDEDKGTETATGASDALYRVQVGAYQNRKYADALQDKLKNAGFSSFVTKS